MNYEEFKARFIDDITERIAEKGDKMKLSTHTINKLNETYEALTATPEGSQLGVNINLDRFYEAYSAGMPYDLAVDRATELIDKGLRERPEINVETLTDYEQVKNKLAIEVVSADTNKEVLANVPHKNIEDMAIVYRLVMESDENGRASILVTNSMVNSFGITPEQLHNDAIENAPQIKPAEIRGMSEVLREIMGPERAEMMGLNVVDPADEKIFVATVPDKVHGAGVIAYQDFMDKAAERVGGDFFILPSSLHEILIVPDNGEVNLDALKSMVKEVNANEVRPEDKLTDSVYHYDSKDKIFELGEKFVNRQMERKRALAEKEVKPEKKSIVDELKSMKDEVAKIPKKNSLEKPDKARTGEVL